MSFPIIQILREIISWDSTSAKSAILTHLEVLDLDFDEFLHSLKAEIHPINIIRSPKNGQNGIFSKIDFT